MRIFLINIVLFIMFSCKKSGHDVRHSEGVSKSVLKESPKYSLDSINFEKNQRKIKPVYKIIPIDKRFSNPLLDTNKLYNDFSVYLNCEKNDSIELTIKRAKYKKYLLNFIDDPVFIGVDYIDDNHSLILYDNRTQERDTICNINLGNKSDKVPIKIKSKSFNIQFEFYLSPKYHAYSVNYYSDKVMINLHRYSYAQYE